jgi:uncharacterized peroxidase-related enzyme
MVTLDQGLIDALRRDWRTAPIDDRDKTMLEYVERLTRDAPSITPADLDTLRSAGFDDQAILQINLIASFFNYINRVADGLGVGRE